ncbi:MAG: glycosyltransferase [Lachnospiraceae bacterium]|nr:glycosyltransferase [Lachnospiraceae bacterium]
MKFSIIVVSLNEGNELKKTVDSVLNQTYRDFEVIVKDGGSVDGSPAYLINEKQVKLIISKDKSLYDAMNQAVEEATGDYILFLNCGDYLMDKTVLAKTAKFIAGHKADLYYGDLYRRKLKSTDVAPDRITDFVCFRNVPCHQVCFYSGKLFESRGYKLRYKIRADYEHFLWCIYEAKATCEHLPFVISDYEGDGISESEANRKIAAIESKEITKKYLGFKRHIFRLAMILTLQPLRKRMADSPKMSETYHKIKSFLYRSPTHKDEEKGSDK